MTTLKTAGKKRGSTGGREPFTVWVTTSTHRRRAHRLTARGGSGPSRPLCVWPLFTPYLWPLLTRVCGSDSWFIVLLCFVCTTAIAACSVCGCCGVGYGDSSWHKCMKDDSYKRINSLLVVVFGGGFGILIWPMLISEKMSDVLLEITVFCLIVACCAWSCLSCCTKTEEDMGDDEEDNEKRKMRRTNACVPVPPPSSAHTCTCNRQGPRPLLRVVRPQVPPPRSHHNCRC